MASPQASAPLNISESGKPSQLSSKKRPLNGIASSDSSNHHTNGYVTPRSNIRESVNAPTSVIPEAGRRKRKKTRAFEIPGPTFVRRVNTGAMGVSGLGVKLSTIPNIMYAMDKRHAKAPEIEFLHRLLFNSAGTAVKRKSNIRTFSGFMFQSDKERGRVRDKLMRSHLNLLRRVAAMLDVSVKQRKDSKSGEGNSPPEDAEIEMAAEAFLGTDSLVSEDVNGGTRAGQVTEERISGEEKGAVPQLHDSQSVALLWNGKAADTNALPMSTSGKETPDNQAGQEGSNDDFERAKADRNLSRQRREESARGGKEETVHAILCFLEMPRISEGRVNLAQREKEKKRQKKAMEKVKVQKALQKKAEERKKELLAKKKARESDEDGDEDLELEAKPWIVLARERQERELQHLNDSEVGSEVKVNGHS